MNGWKYEWASELPRDVYDLIVEDMNEAAKRQNQDT